MKKLSAIIFLSFIAFQTFGMRPYYEEIEVTRLPAQAHNIVLAELVSGEYDRENDKYKATLATVAPIKGSTLSEFGISHQHRWNRLEKLGGYYLIYLDSNKQLIKTGSAIVPIVGFGGPFSDSKLDEAAVTYELPEGAWFTMSGKLWGLANCLAGEHPTCAREKELMTQTFNKSKQQGGPGCANAHPCLRR